MAGIKRALLSCHDKTGLERFAKGLVELGVELVASTGTAAFLKEHGISARSVESFAGITEQLDGRVKTLHPRIHAGILARRQAPAHVKAVGEGGLIDLVVVNLYPFEDTIQQPGATLAQAVEQIDIGGVALLRAAAKNFSDVTVISSPQQYPAVLEALTRGKGALPETMRRDLAMVAFALTSRYDRQITRYLGQSGATSATEPLTLQARPQQSLRYGENPHQRGGWYVPLAGGPEGLARLSQRQGKALSYNNLLDVDTAVRCLADFDRPTCVIVKHASPCGIASADSAAEACRRAYEADAESAFGGIVGVNRPLEAEAASQMTAGFLEVLLAPSIEPAALAVLAKKPNLRVLELAPQATPAASPSDWRSVLGGWLVHDPDTAVLEEASLRVATKRRPTDEERRDLLFAWRAAKHVRSNAIVLAKDEATVGIGQGQPSRVRAVRLAIQNAGARARGAALASDGFLPFPDNVEHAAGAGVTALIQPGGALKDAEVIAAADGAGMAMLFTGIRHFRH